MVSKTWYDFIENDGGLWNNLMRKLFEDIQKNHGDTEIGWLLLT